VALFNFFIQLCRDQLHIVLAMSPIGDAFRRRLRMFPSLINCCTIDWFQVGTVRTNCTEFDVCRATEMASAAAVL